MPNLVFDSRLFHSTFFRRLIHDSSLSCRPSPPSSSSTAQLPFPIRQELPLPLLLLLACTVEHDSRSPFHDCRGRQPVDPRRRVHLAGLDPSHSPVTLSRRRKSPCHSSPTMPFHACSSWLALTHFDFSLVEKAYLKRMETKQDEQRHIKGRVLARLLCHRRRRHGRGNFLQRVRLLPRQVRLDPFQRQRLLRNGLHRDGPKPNNGSASFSPKHFAFSHLKRVDIHFVLAK